MSLGWRAASMRKHWVLDGGRRRAGAWEGGTGRVVVEGMKTKTERQAERDERNDRIAASLAIGAMIALTLAVLWFGAILSTNITRYGG